MRMEMAAPSCSLCRLVFIILAGCFVVIHSENISIQYVIIHTTSNVSSSVLPSAPAVAPSSTAPPIRVSTSTAIATATSMTSDWNPSPSYSPIGSSSNDRPLPSYSSSGAPNTHHSKSSYSPVGASSSSLMMALRGNEHFFAVTYEHQIPGSPGKDYPILSEIPVSNFNCADYKQSGYFADQQSGCQVIHICQEDGTKESFLCPNGTIFNQQYLVCDWWFNVDCSKSRSFYNLNSVDYPQQSIEQQGEQSENQSRTVAGPSYSSEDASPEVTEYVDDESQDKAAK